MGEEPGPIRRAAIGPERKATKAIGPQAAVAKEISPTAATITSSRVVATGTPRAEAASSPSCVARRSFARDSSTGARTARAPSTSLSWSQDELLRLDRKSTRLNSSHVAISYAVFCLKKKKRRG